MSKTKDDNDLKSIIATGHTLPSVNPDLAEEVVERTPKRKKADPTDYIADLEREKDEDALDFEI